MNHHRVQTSLRRQIRRPGVFALVPLALAACVLLACGGGKKKTNTPATRSAAAPSPQAARATTTTPPLAQPTAALTVTAFPQATLRPGTPVPGSPTASPTPTATPTPGVRTENGLQIQDVAFTGRVTTSGGLRIHSSPSVSSSVVGSVPEGAVVNVEGKVLNGDEGESGKGTVWCIVGTQQYMYCPEGYVTNVGAAATPAPRAAPASTPAR